MTARVIDFDAFLAERKAQEGDTAEAPRVKVGGKEYTLPVDLPAIVAVEVLRGMREQGADAEVAATTLEEIGRALFGDQWGPMLRETQMGLKEMAQLIIQVFSLYDPSQGEETIPNRRTRRAQKRSTSSRTGR